MASTNPSTPNVNVAIRIEPTDEYKIEEITYDGQEKSIPPLSMSDNLSKLIQKLDFNQPIDELKKELETKPEDLTEESAEELAKSRLPPGPSRAFDSISTKLRLAFTEICVLIDVLSIAKAKKYMVFDVVNPKTQDQWPIVNIMAKKRALQMASQILLDGANTLRSISGNPKLAQPTAGSSANDNWSPGESSSASNSFTQLQPEPNFYDELKQMRQNWHLKRMGNHIFGDLSYFRPAGYRFTAGSRFAVMKTTAANRGPANQAISVNIPVELEGRAHIQVSIIKNDDISLVDLTTCANGRYYEATKERTWQEKLELAQNVLFCKELFRHLANQAVQYQFVIPTTVTGNQIILALFPDIKLYITLVHHTPNTKSTREITEGMKKLQQNHKPVFEHSLHQMLRDFYANVLKRAQARDVPREAGPCAMDKQTLFDISRQDSSLDKIVQQAQHLIMRQQTMDIIDTFAAQIKDPLLISHWFCLNSPTSSIVRVDIVSKNNETLGRSHMLIYVGTRQLRVVTRDCKNLVLGYEPDELKHLLIWQSCLHQFIASDKLTKVFGWYTLILNYNVNVTRAELSSTAFSLVVCSSNCNHLISLKSGPQFGLTVDVAQFKQSSVSNSLDPMMMMSSLMNGRHEQGEKNENSLESYLNSSLNDCGDSRKLSKLHELVDNFREVDWDKMQGRDFLAKLELLMAALTDLS